MAYSNHTSNNKNYEVAIADLFKESKESGKTIALDLSQDIGAADALLGKAAEKAIDIVQDKLGEVAEPEI